MASKSNSWVINQKKLRITTDAYIVTPVTLLYVFTFPDGIRPSTSFPLAIRDPMTTEYATTLEEQQRF